jgi:hypothetical protein
VASCSWICRGLVDRCSSNLLKSLIVSGERAAAVEYVGILAGRNSFEPSKFAKDLRESNTAVERPDRFAGGALLNCADGLNEL